MNDKINGQLSNVKNEKTLLLELKFWLQIKENLQREQPVLKFY